MGITQLNFELKNKVEVAIEALRLHEPPEGYYLADSGGKDSTAVRLLTKMSGVKFDAHYCVSPIDPPQIYKFLKEYHSDTKWDFHAKGFWKHVDSKGLPMRNHRWCCQLIKEGGGIDRTCIIGIRGDESSTRKHKILLQSDYKRSKLMLHPIIGWSQGEVWELLQEHNEPYCELYDIGATGKYKGNGIFQRLGCVLCPFSKDTELEEYYFPKIAHLWKLACDRIISQQIARGYKTKTGKEIKNKFKTGQEMYDWWTRRY